MYNINLGTYFIDNFFIINVFFLFLGHTLFS